MIRVLVVAFAIACTSPPKGAPIMPTDTCDDAVDKLLAKDIAQWRGLPDNCNLAALKNVEIGTDESRGLLGSDGINTYYRRVKAPAYAEVMKVWLRDETIVRISVPLPELADPRALVRSLGEPDAKLDTYFQTTPTVHKQGEWVYAHRGLALVLSFDRAVVMELIVFAPTTLDDYVKRLRFSEQPRESRD
jgi:hypothetical protein